MRSGSLLLLCSTLGGCYLFKSGAIDETCEDLDGGCEDGGPDVDRSTDDLDGDGLSPADGDCDDNNPDVYTGAPDAVGDGVDNNCDGLDGVDGDSDGFASVDSGGDDCLDDDPAVNPAAQEVCDGLGQDDDCNGLADADDPDVVGASIHYADGDGDGYGDPAVPVLACGPDGDVIDNDEDCDDAVSAVNPGATEVCNNGVDDNCNGSADGCRSPDGLADVTDAEVHVRDRSGSAQYGHRIRGADLDQDGAYDVLITDPNHGGGVAQLFVNPSGLVEASAAVATFTTWLTGVDQLGLHAELAGDLTGDGFDDLVLADDDGAVLIFDGPFSGAYDEFDAHARLGAASMATTGNPLHTGDFDDDGWADLIVGDPGGSRGAGEVSVLLGPIAPTSGADAVAVAESIFYGAASGTDFGGAALAVPLWGEATSTVVVGASQSRSGKGHVSVFDSGLSRSMSESDRSFGITASLTATALGTTLASGDLDGDGAADLVVCGPTARITGDASGLCGVVTRRMSTDTDVADLSIQITAAMWRDNVVAQMGARVSIGDVDGDGQDDLVVGARGSQVEGVVRAGAALVYYGPLASGVSNAGDAQALVSSTSTDASIGHDVFIGESATPDGRAVLMVGASELTSVAIIVAGGW